MTLADSGAIVRKKAEKILWERRSAHVMRDRGFTGFPLSRGMTSGIEGAGHASSRIV
jgi:hypothetical protein